MRSATQPGVLAITADVTIVGLAVTVPLALLVLLVSAREPRLDPAPPRAYPII